jgi:hypothetical protein
MKRNTTRQECFHVRDDEQAPQRLSIGNER